MSFFRSLSPLIRLHLPIRVIILLLYLRYIPTYDFRCFPQTIRPPKSMRYCIAVRDILFETTPVQNKLIPELPLKSTILFFFRRILTNAHSAIYRTKADKWTITRIVYNNMLYALLQKSDTTAVNDDINSKRVYGRGGGDITAALWIFRGGEPTSHVLAPRRVVKTLWLTIYF